MIHFFAPHFLYGLFLLAIPVIIHLFNFRRYKKVLFTNVRFLREIKEETSRVSKLKHLLVLACRLLAVLFLVLAFAQPYLPAENVHAGSKDGPVSVYVDNSFSMDAVSSQGTVLEVARLKAREIVLSYPASTRIQLLTNDFEAIQQRLISREDALDEIDRIHFSSVSRKLSEVLLRQKEALSAHATETAASFIISDFQKSTSDFEELPFDSLMKVSMVALPLQETANVFVDSCWLNSPVVQLNQPLEINVSIRNGSSVDAENIPVRLFLNGVQRTVTSLNIPSGESANTSFNITIGQPGWQKAEVRITDHPITFDDSYYFSFEVREKLNVLTLYDGSPSPYLDALFKNDLFFAYTRSEASKVDYSALLKQHCIVLEDLSMISSGLAGEIKKFLEAGGTLCVFPDSLSDLSSWNYFFNLTGADVITGINHTPDKVVQADLDHKLFEGVFDLQKLKDVRTDYPASSGHFDFSVSSRSKKQVLMRFQGGSPFLSWFPTGKGSMYVFSVPLHPGFSNLSRHAMFAPLLYRMAVLSIKPIAFSNILGRSEKVVLHAQALNGDEVFHLVSEDKKSDIIPYTRVTGEGLQVDIGEEIKNAGHYDLLKGKVLNAVLSFNYDRSESLMSFYTDGQLKDMTEESGFNNWKLLTSTTQDIGKTLRVLNSGIPLWKYAILLTLLFLLIETLLIRFWKTS